MPDWGLIPEQIPQMDMQQPTPPPFSMVSGSDPTYQGARFYNQSGQEYLPPTGVVNQPYDPPQSSPYVPDPSQYATQGTIQPMQQSPQMQQIQSPYAVQTYQPVQYNYPQWLNDPKSQQMQQDIYYGSGQNFVQAYPRNAKKDGSSVWSDSIAPVVGQILGGRQLGSFLQNQAIANRQQKFQQQQQAISALNASTNFLGTFAIRPQQKQADAENRSREKNANAGNKAAQAGFTEGQKNYRMNTQEAGRQYRFAVKENRQERSMAFNQKHKTDLLNNHKAEFDKIQDRLNTSSNDLNQYRKMSLLAQMRGQDIHEDSAARNLAFRIQEAMLDHQFDINKLNANAMMEFNKAKEKGDLPPDAKPDEYLLELNSMNSIDPSELGLDRQGFDSLVNEISSFGQPRQYQPLNQPQQQQQMGQSQYQPMQVAPQQMQQQPMQQAPAPQKQGVSFKRGSLLNAKSGSAAPSINPQTFIQSSNGDANAAKTRLIQRAQQRGLPYAQAVQAAEAILGAQ